MSKPDKDETMPDAPATAITNTSPNTKATETASPPHESPPNPTQPSKKRKRTPKPHIHHASTYQKPTWTYFHLELLTPIYTDRSLPPQQPTDAPIPTAPPKTQPKPGPRPLQSYMTPSTPAPTQETLSPLTISTLLTQPLQSFLGLTGSVISIDILATRHRETWIRVPRQDARALRAGLSGWIGYCGAEVVPGAGEGVNGSGRVRVAWRVRGEGSWLGGLVGAGEGDDLFVR